MAVNQCPDFIKAKQLKKRLGFLTRLFNAIISQPHNGVVTVDHPVIDAENKESFQLLPGIIDALPDNQKTAIILTKIEDRPQQEVTQIINMSAKAVKLLLQRTKLSIAKKLTKSDAII